jgi:trigger factor
MEDQVEEFGPLKKKIAVSVSALEVDAGMDEVVSRYRASVSVPGFRKGKAPGSMIEKLHAGQIRQEVLSGMLEKQARDIMTELKAETASGLEYDCALPQRGQDYHYSFSFEALPEFTLPDYQDFPLEQEEVAVSEEEVSSVLERMRYDLGESVPVEEKRAARDGELVTLDFTAYDEVGEEVPHFKEEGAQVLLGQPRLPEDFARVIKSVLNGEEGEGVVSLPAAFLNPELAGKSLRLKVKIHGIRERRLAELNDDFAQKAGGFASVEAMRVAVHSEFLRGKARASKLAAQERMLDALLQKGDFPLPESLVDRSAENIFNGAMQRFQGDIPDEEKEKVRVVTRKEAERQVRSLIFLRRAAQAENVKVEESDILRELQHMAASSGRGLEELRAEYARNNAWGALYESVMTDKAMEAVYDRAAVTFVKPAEQTV